MSLTLSRRSFIIGSSLLLPTVGLGAGTALSAENDIAQQLASLEKRTGGRLGVSVLDTNTNVSFGHRQDERFAMCSTFKALAAAFVLARVDKGEENLDRRIAVSNADLLSHSPIAEKHLADGMTVG
ncbi:MAG: serine hydrolase, partial [Pararhizobium sp.]